MPSCDVESKPEVLEQEVKDLTVPTLHSSSIEQSLAAVDVVQVLRGLKPLLLVPGTS